jgi:AICAR transformylase/IMP cyclohydrolase PurH
MNELALKYGCNPNQKPSRIYMEDGSDLPVTVLNGKPGYINFLDALNSIQLVKELKAACGLPAFEAAACAVYLHGAAADRAAALHGETGMLPHDLLDALGTLFAENGR